MKNFNFSVLAICLLLSSLAFAIPQAYDGFDYPKYESIAGQDGGKDWQDSWTITSANGVAAIKSPGLEYESLPVNGNCVNVVPVNDKPTVVFSRNMSEQMGQDGTTVWAGYLLKGSKIGDGHLFMRINQASVLTFGKRWGTAFSFDNTGSSKNMVKDNIYFIVAKFDCLAGNDNAYLWINPALTNEPSTTAADVFRNDSNLGTGRNVELQIQGYGNGNYDIDEVRIATTWANLIAFGEWGTNAPNVTTSIIASAGTYTNKIGVVWDAASGATKYALYRNSINNTNSAILVTNNLLELSYADFSATGITNYYWVKAGNAFGWSAFSQAARGWLGASNAIDISGLVEDPNGLYGAGANYCLIDDTQFGQAVGQISGKIFFYNNFLTLNSSVATTTILSGSLSGSGSLIIDNANSNCISKITGSSANTLSGNYIVNGGTLVLAKDAGIDAVNGPILLDGTSRAAVLALENANQIADNVDLTIKGTIGAIVRTAGNNETLGTLTVQGHALIDLGGSTGDIHFENSSSILWKAGIFLVIENSGPANRIYFCSSSAGLSTTQLAAIQFKDPVGLPAGFYQATIENDGEITPTILVPQPFDNSAAAQEARLESYDNQGQAQLSGTDTPLEDNMVISCFGDSITWLDNANSYVNALKSSLASGAGTSSKNIVVKRNGINGGTAADILNGKSGVQASLQDLLDSDQPDIVTMFIGINDIWWAGTSAAAYESTMRSIATTIKTNNIRYFVMATPWLRNELPDNSNINDAKIIQFAEICSNIAVEVQSPDFNVVFLDLHWLGMNYLQNNNNKEFINYMPDWQKSGYLTYDGVHPNSIGAQFLADQIAFATVESLDIPEPALLGFMLFGFLFFSKRR